MKKLLSSLLLLTILMSFTTFQTPERIVFFGDSITQQGVRPKGYITNMQEMLKAKGLDKNYELIGAGIGGNKVTDLYLRLEDDVLAKNPNTVVIFIGTNDVWHKTNPGTGTDPDKFEKFYNAIIKKLQAKNIKVVLVTPGAIGEKTDFTNEQDGDLNKYAAIVRKIAANNNCSLIDMRKVFLDYNLINNKNNEEKGILTTDRVHLTDTGNQVVAEQMYKHLIK
ncbi:SGNH/GDSL hydrolase family protein [Pseudoflavitalea sp. G-6-1-2]|uniref:SGNH/GDSL hydrolase family protein n=1 Tax=Pseudoflavitalea sp. G-6-1-2 TaxID=2728841 RepID=UPI00146D17A2|nr:SGNH/GDSL hydrolase family protein [Pseudoflavitalea sp. G-6-1-2]NML22145.1 SGNH/GDSL hydrolase family protein [Pseudoflavitalea sp. G-6-1-2]